MMKTFISNSVLYHGQRKWRSPSCDYIHRLHIMYKIDVRFIFRIHISIFIMRQITPLNHNFSKFAFWKIIKFYPYFLSPHGAIKQLHKPVFILKCFYAIRGSYSYSFNLHKFIDQPIWLHRWFWRRHIYGTDTHYYI